MRPWSIYLVPLVILSGITLISPAHALDDEHYARANEAIERGIAYLRSTQGADGSWSREPGPAVTALAVTPMLDHPDHDPDDPATQKAVAYILSKVQPDGGIYDGILPNYNTAICLAALARVSDQPGVAEMIRDGQDFLRELQWSSQVDPGGRAVDEEHPFFGGAGYGNHGRPDLSNTQVMLQGLYESGLDCTDEAFQRAVVFISRCQGVPQNDMFGDRIIQDGGFIYATSLDKDHIGVPESKASPALMDEAKLGRPVSGLRTYGSMTYAGFKSYLYALLRRDDPRVVAAYEWIRRHYTLDVNPGMPAGAERQGLFYYYVTFARAMNAWGDVYITTADGEKHDWANDLVDKLVELQREDGSWVNDADRWMEGDPNLVTAYALIALTEAIK